MRAPRLGTLDRKMLRELWRLRSQLLSIGAVVATAVVTLVALRGTHRALAEARDAYYRDYRLADVWAPVERAPETLREEILALPGVASVSTRVTTLATLDLPWLDAPGLGLFVSIPDGGAAPLGALHLVRGRRPAPASPDEVLASEAFARTNALEPGDSIRAVLEGRFRVLRIVGIAISPEHSYSVPPGGLFPDDERFGVFWMARSALAPAIDAEGAFTEVAVALAPGASERAVIRRLDLLLERHGGLGAYGRSELLSYRIVEDELSQNRAMSLVVPAIFLGVAAFLLNLVLSRLIATQRTEIGTLKAFGYTDAQVARHYLGYAVAAVLAGALVGAAAGAWAGAAMVDLYGDFFRFPTLRYRLSWTLVLQGAGVSLAAAVGGAWLAVRRATRLAPAEAMRPEPPPTFRPGPLERAGVARLLPSGGRLVLRNLERRPLRALASVLGIAFSVGLLVVGAFMFDGTSRMMELQFRVAQREDLSVAFLEPRAPRVVREIARRPGVIAAEPYHDVPVTLRSGHREQTLALSGLPADGTLRSVVDAEGRVHPLPLRGLLLGAWVARALDVEAGDEVVVEMRTGRRRTAVLPVARVVEDFLGASAHLTLDELQDLTGEGPRVSGALLRVDPLRADDVGRALARAPAVATVVSPAASLAAFEEQLSESLLVSVVFMLGFASVISVAIVYNGTRIALSERARELAALRVLGFQRQEVARLLLGEQGALTVLALPVGCVLGYLLAWAVLAGIASEAYRIPLVVSLRTYLLAIGATLVSAGVSGWLVRRRLDRLDLISVFKTRE